MLDTLITWLQPWADLFAESTWLSTTLIAVHVTAMFLGGGVAVGADRHLLRERASGGTISLLTASHGWVIVALLITNLSGVALAAADLSTFASSRVFWAKMLTLLLLLANGVWMRRLERQWHPATGDAESPADHRQALQWSARASLTGWVLIVVLGVVLGNG